MPTTRLLSAVRRGLLPALAEFAFVASGDGGGRGETVECSNGAVRIVVQIDYVEGEFGATLERVGEASIEIRHRSRLSRAVTSGILEAELRHLAETILRDYSDLLRPPE